ncbi:MAG: AAA family ATPase [Muribaculaceae bacterium]|nr:AAA family ATPase [Muribaculaceae bacterium]
MGEFQKYGIGQQDFRNLIEEDCIYVDKTRYIETILNSGSKYYFLARPRRFGKSLFLSTLQYFFEGRRELFKGLYIDSVEALWETHPVLRLDLNKERYATPGKLEDVLDKIFRNWEETYGVERLDNNLPQRFEAIIEKAHSSSGKRVVILVDEYDKPLVGNINDEKTFEHYRMALASLYSNFKSNAEHIRLVFLTGVSRFSRLSVFSELNNLSDITFDNRFADVCGITDKEVLENLKPGIARLAKTLDVSFDCALMKLKKNYDGYRFT